MTNTISSNSFNVRNVTGWLSDFSSVARMETWPSTVLDQQLMADLEDMLSLAQFARYTQVSLWGLLTARHWAPYLPQTADAERLRQVNTILEMAHQRGLKVLHGMGLYNWGFESIIAYDPGVDGGDVINMCGSRPRSQTWMENVLRYLFTTLDIDGVAVQSSDQGRCQCDMCSALPALEYHAMLNARTTDFIRANFPGKQVYINTWGMDLSNPDDLPHIQKMAQDADVFIDYNNSSSRRSPAHRTQVAHAMTAAFGTIQGWWIEPLPFWDRMRLFLPFTLSNVPYLRQLHADGGRAVEQYCVPLNNPAARVSFIFDGLMQQDINRDPDKTLREALEVVFEPVSSGITDVLAELFCTVENGFLVNSRHGEYPQQIVSSMLHYTHGNPIHPAVERPQYLMRLKRAKLDAFGQTLHSAQHLFDQIQDQLNNRIYAARLGQALRYMLADVALTQAYHQSDPS